MPLYEYQCGTCGHRFEVIQKFSDAPITVCPKCGASTVEKMISSPAIQFKGSGWYITDYARSGKTESATTPGSSSSSAKPEGGAAGGAASPSESKSESTAAPPPAATTKSE